MADSAGRFFLHIAAQYVTSRLRLFNEPLAGWLQRVAVQDQAALRGLLNQLWDLNLTLVSLHRIVPEREGA